jgi:apolipoprotein N-acyltransferase
VKARRAWMAGYVATTFFSFPHPLPLAFASAGGSVLDLGMVVSFLAPVCLVFGLVGLRIRSAASSAFLWTVAAHGLVLHFIYVVTVEYGHAPALVGVLAPAALAVYAATLAALFGAGWVWLRDRGLGGAWTAAVLWTALDHLRSIALSGWPWATLGYAQHLNPPLLGLAQFTGVYGLSFVVVLGGLAFAECVQAVRAGRRPSVATVSALVCVLALHAFGFANRTQPGVNDDMLPETIRIAAIQGNIDQGVKWNAAWVERTLAIYEDLSRQAVADGAQIVVWPETAVPGAIEADEAMRGRIAALSHESGATFVVGGVGVEFGSAGRIASFYDSAFIVLPEAGVVDRYDKTHLVPFGEYVPLRDLLGAFFGAVASGMARGDVTPGPSPRAVRLPVATLAGGERLVKVGVPICYELLFPDLVRRFVADGGGILLGITNDAWYGRTGAPYHFLAITAMRSAESGSWLVRAANTGISAVIDSGGRVRQQTRIFERGYLVADVPLRRPPAESASGGTFYVRHGDVFAAGCWLALLSLVGSALWRARSHRNEQG